DPNADIMGFQLCAGVEGQKACDLIGLGAEIGISIFNAARQFVSDCVLNTHSSSPADGRLVAGQRGGIEIIRNDLVLASRDSCGRVAEKSTESVADPGTQRYRPIQTRRRRVSERVGSTIRIVEPSLGGTEV